jgi:predicted AlkP superfamily phosphohydrolase/phosphomutase
MKNNVIIIGIDGGTMGLIEQLIEEGEMKNLRSLISKGVSGELESTLPPITPPAWVSFQTGTSPLKHKVFSFAKVTDEGYPSDEIVASTSIKIKTLWEYLSEMGETVLIVNLPLTYPPYEVNGIIVSGPFTPDGASNYTYPSEIKDELEAHNFGPLRLTKWASFYLQEKLNLPLFIKEMESLLTYRKDIFLYLFNKYHPKIGVVHFHSVDVVQHVCWGFLDKEHWLYDRKLYNEVIPFYRKLDECIGEIIKQVGEERLIVILSDHGFKSYKKTVNLARWLYKNGYLLSLTKRDEKSKELLMKTFQLLRKLVPNFVKKRITQKGIGKKVIQFESELNIYENLLRKEWVAIPGGGRFKTVYGEIYLNPTIEKKEEIKNKLIAQLSTLVDPETNEQVVKQCVEYKKTDNLGVPDLIVIPTSNYIIHPGNPFGELFRKVELGGDWHIGEHSLKGMYIFCGPHIKEGKKLNMKIKDIAPTLLGYMNLPIPTYMEGNFIVEMFTEKKEIKYQEDKGEREKLDQLPEVEEELMKQKLKQLGYM